MPSKSKTQQRTMGAALAVKKGDLKPSEIKNKKFKEKVEDIAGDMSKKELDKFASTKHKGLPEKKKKESKKQLEKNGKKTEVTHTKDRKVLSKSELAKLGKEAKKKTMKETYDIGVNGDKLFLSEQKINQIINKYSYGSITKKQLMEKIEKSKKLQ